MLRHKRQLYLRVFFLVFGDVILINLASLFALWVQHDLTLKVTFHDVWSLEFLRAMLVTTIITLLIFALTRLYNSLWTFDGADELLHAALASGAVAVVNFVLIATEVLPFARSFALLQAVFLLVLTVAYRFFYRFVRSVRQKSTNRHIRTMIIGAGSMGGILLHELKKSPNSVNKVVCLIDDNPHKKGYYMNGVRVVGGREKIVEAAKEYAVQEIILAMPSVSAGVRREILEICQKTNCELRIVPALYQLANGEVRVEKMRRVEIEDLLGRSAVEVDWDKVAEYVKGKNVLVTGGGGSIGSELCRQIAKQKPQSLIIFDIYENNAYAIQQELLYSHPELNLTVLIGSVRDAARVDSIFEQYGIDLVYHAAAHKHVPLMEDSPAEAVKNNIFGTQNVARAAGKYGVSRFVMISTDKAVNPTNVMGASKQVCEMVVQQESANYPNTIYTAVRFGNVLGSNGSVIPLFRKQIEAGGPVTVTHPDIIRYFMTIPEAVSLVLQSGALAKDGEIFVLDMGEPVKIDDLARNMIRLSGFIPDEDIKITYTGLRPGEKMFEELLMAEEGLQKTANNKIFIGRHAAVDFAVLTEHLEAMRALPEDRASEVRRHIRALVPTYHAEQRR